MRVLFLLCTMAGALAGVEAAPAPTTVTTSEGTGPTAGERATTASLAADDAWTRARNKALNEQRLRHAQAARDSATANLARTQIPEQPLDPGGLAGLVEGDELALLLELQRRRRNLGGNAASASDKLLTAELAAILLAPSPRLSVTPQIPTTGNAAVHPDQEPHPGPLPPTSNTTPDRPEHLPVR